MKNILLLAGAILFTTNCYSQTNLVNNGTEFNRSNDTLTLQLLSIPCTNDNAGISEIEVPDNMICPEQQTTFSLHLQIMVRIH